MGPSRADENGNGLSDGLDERLATLGPGETVDVIVTFEGPGNAASALVAVGAFSVTHEYRLVPGFAATMTGPQAQALAVVPGVFRVSLDGTMYAYMETARISFGVDDPSGLSVIPGGVTGQDVVICVIDSGIWPEHEQFIAAFNGDPGTTKVEKFRDFVGDGASTETEPGVQARDEHYHGTLVAAIAAGDGTEIRKNLGGNSTLAWPLHGVAPGSALWGAQVLEPTADGGATGPDSGVMAGVEWCVDEWQAEAGSRKLVINMSLGSPGLSCEGDPVAAAVDAAFAAGAAVIVASGNSGDGSNSQGTPACAAGAFSVAAAGEYSLPLTMPELGGIESYGLYVAPFSSRGAGMLGGATGPGVSVASAFNTTTVLPFSGCSLGQPGCYAAANGTSFASPFVAGIAALVFDADPTLGPGEVYQILRDTARPWGPGGTPNEIAGAGMVDAQAAVEAALNGGTTACLDYSPSPGPIHSVGTGFVANNGNVRYPVYVDDPDLPLAVTLSIDGSVSAFGVWSPDLEMRLLDANQNPYLIPNPLYPDFSSEPFLPALGTTSTCPAGEDCGIVGAQETIHLALPVDSTVDDLTSPGPHHWIEVFPFGGFPNSGAGGTFTLEFSNAYSDSFGSEPGLCLTANAGPDQTVIDTDGSGAAMVNLDGSGSVGAVSYDWTEGGVPIGSGVSPSVNFALGTHTVTLEVSDGAGDLDSDTMVVTVQAPDTTAPTPNPMTWASVPAARGSTAIVMTATTASDPSGGIQYYFACTAGGGGCVDSGWQADASYTATGLAASTEYTFRVKARDALLNETALSVAQSATTDPLPDTTAPTPDPMTWASVPAATGSTSIAMTATTASDPSGGIEYYFACTPGSGMSESSDPSWSNVVLLTYLDADTPLDESNSAHTLTPDTGAALNTTVKRFGAASFEFDNTSAANIMAADSADWTLGQQFTIEAWVYWPSVIGLVDEVVVSHFNPTGNQKAWLFGWRQSDPGIESLRFRFSSDGGSITTILGAWSPSAATWYHIAVTRDSNNDFRLFVDGTQVGSTTNNSAAIFASSAALRIGNVQVADDTGSLPFSGNIDDLRITKGVARYGGANFTPPAGGGGCVDSGWQAGPSYTATGLDLSTRYTFQVKARDGLGNETAMSVAQSATTDTVASDTTAPTPDPMTWASVPAASGSTAIAMTATTASDPSGGIEYNFACTPGSSMSVLGDPSWSNVVLLTYLDDATPLDESNSAHTLTPDTGAALDTTVKRFGAASFDFDNTSAANIAAADSADWTLGQQFTIEVWVYWPSVTGLVDEVVVSHFNPTGNQKAWFFGWRNSDPGTASLRFRFSGDGSSTTTILGAWSPSAATWYHIAVTRDSSNDIRLFVDGTQVGGTTNNSSAIFASSAALRIGNVQVADDTGSLPFSGNIDDLRITKGVARYTANFTPPAGGGGCVNSGWQASASYTATGLDPSTRYTFRVKARDGLGNETALSVAQSATTDAVASDTTAPTPDPMTWASVPAATGSTEIAMTATTASDPSGGIQYYFACTAGGSGCVDSGWQASASYTATGLDPSTEYTFQVKARDALLNETAPSVAQSATTDPANTPPVADAKAVVTDEDVAVAITLTGSDADGDALTFAVATLPSNGSLSGTAPNLTYTPDAGYNGSDSFTYTASDGTLDSAPATVSITVDPVNDAPVADAKAVVTGEDTAVAITLTGSDADGDALTFAVATPPSNGSLSGTAPNLTYTPDAGYNGSDSFTYTASDGIENSAPATVAITVDPANSAPVADAGGDQTHVLTDTLIVYLDGIASWDPDGDPITYAWSMLSKPKKSNSVLQGMSTMVASFDPDVTGTYEIQLLVTDDFGSDTDVATITIEKPPKNGGGGGGGGNCNGNKPNCP
jgi:hypothetical protein